MNIYQKIINVFSSLEKLVYPELCAVCCNSLFANELAICNRCIKTLPKSLYHTNDTNPVIKTFWGRVPLQFASAHFIFRKETGIQHLLHSIKYDNRQDAAIVSGKLMGRDVQNDEWFQQIDFIVPVPLHPAKLAKRGYNQSEVICKGVCEITEKKHSNDNLVRTQNTSTQTKKNRFQRWENVEYVFKVLNEAEFKNKHILLVDDVITTGATIEGCVNVLLKVEGVKVSVLALAHAI